jgi:hypothetical protein
VAVREEVKLELAEFNAVVLVNPSPPRLGAFELSVAWPSGAALVFSKLRTARFASVTKVAVALRKALEQRLDDLTPLSRTPADTPTSQLEDGLEDA